MPVRRPRWLWPLVAGAVLLAAVVLVRAVPDAAPQSDFAIIDAQVLNVLRGEQALGQPSRFGWSHPGPLYFEVLAPLYLLSGYRHLSTVVTAAAVNLLALAAVLVLLRRRAADAGPATAAAVLLGLFLWRAPGLLASPWNPHVPILPLAWLLTAAAAVAAGQSRLLPWTIGVASFVMQAHVGFAPAALAILAGMSALALPSWIRTWRDPEQRRPLARALAIAAAVACVVWALPLVDELRSGGQHNLSRIAAFFRDQTPGDARVLGRAFAEYFVAPFARTLSLPWGHDYWPARDLPVEAAAQIQGLLLLAAAVWWYRRRPFERALAVLTVMAAVAAFVSVRRLPSHPNDHGVYWVAILGVMSWVVILGRPLGIALEWAGRRSGVALRRGVAVALAIFAGATAIAAGRQAGEDYRVTRRGEWPVRRMLNLIRPELDRSGVRSPLIHVSQDFWELIAGIVLQLERDGLTPSVDREWVRVFGPATQPGGQAPLEIRLAREGDHLDDFRHRSDHDLLGAVVGTYVYAVRPVPRAIALDAPPEIAAAAGSAVLDTARVVDGRWLLDRAGALPPMALFVGTASSITLRVPALPVIGLRVWGQQSVAWQIACSTDGTRFEPFGRVRTPDGDEPLAGDVFLRDLGRCRLLRIQPYDNSGGWSLSEVQWLVSGRP